MRVNNVTSFQKDYLNLRDASAVVRQGKIVLISVEEVTVMDDIKLEDKIDGLKSSIDKLSSEGITTKKEEKEKTVLPKKEVVSFKLREELKAKYHFFTLTDSKELYMYVPTLGIYKDNAEPVVRKILDGMLHEDSNPGLIGTTVASLKDNTYMDRSKLENNPTLLATRNCVLNIDTLEQWKLTPDAYRIKQIPVEYNHKATCPNFNKFIETTVEPEYQKVIQQWFGFCLQETYAPKKAIMIWGKPHSGKTRLAIVLTAFLGEENVVTKTLPSICERFGTTDLYGKMANVSDEHPASLVKDFEKFKALTGESMVEGEIKGVQKKIFFRNTAKMIFLCNEIPPIEHADDSFYSRWIVIPFNKCFNEETGNRINAYDKLMTTPEELSGILNYALQGYNSLKTEKQFAYPDSIDYVKTMWSNGAKDSISMYIKECLVTDGNLDTWVANDTIYTDYCSYCQETGEPNLPKHILLRKIGERIPLTKGQKEGGKHGVYGIELKKFMTEGGN
jgi:putative DNA primase/helicase